MGFYCNGEHENSKFIVFSSSSIILNLCDSIVATKSAIHLLISYFVWIWIRVQATLKSSTIIQFHFETLHHGFQYFIGIVSLIANKSQTIHYWIMVWKNIINMNITLPWTMASIGCPTFQNRTQMTYFAFSIHLEFSVSPPDNVKRAPEMSSLFHLETLFYSHGFLLIFEIHNTWCGLSRSEKK